MRTPIRHQYSEGSVHLVRRKDPQRQFPVEDRVIYYYCQSDEPHLLDFKERLRAPTRYWFSFFGQLPQRGQSPVEQRGEFFSATRNLAVFSSFAVLEGPQRDLEATLGGSELEGLECP